MQNRLIVSAARPSLQSDFWLVCGVELRQQYAVRIDVTKKRRTTVQAPQYVSRFDKVIGCCRSVVQHRICRSYAGQGTDTLCKPPIIVAPGDPCGRFPGVPRRDAVSEPPRQKHRHLYCV